MTVLDHLKQHMLYLDGGMGTLLQQRGLRAGEAPEGWNLTHPDAVREIHRAYFDAGSHVVSANTFGANALRYAPDELERIVAAALDNVRAAREASRAAQEKFVALDIGPTGRLLRPFGDFDFEDAVRAFAAAVRLGVKHGAELILIETMNDSYETKAALLAAKENSDLPVFVSNAYGADGKLMTGATPAAMVAMLEGLHADAIGANCSFGPRQLSGVVEALLACASVPVLFMPNAGLPRSVNGRTVYDVGPEDFAQEVAALVARGVRVAGGCCGTTPAHIEALVRRCQGLEPAPATHKKTACISSYTHAVCFGGAPVLIGERINPTGKKRFQQALRERDIGYVLQEGIRQQEAGAHVLDVNVGLPDVDEPALLCDVVCELQAVVDLPLQIDTSNPVAMEAALRRYNGKALLNSVNGKRESLHSVLPLARKYGALVVALTLDEDGIPATADGRVRIAEKILRAATAYGLGPEDLLFDPLAMTVSADPGAALVTLEAVRRIASELGCHTSLGISNVSFGLPARDAVNATFFACALENGLSAAILNPHSADMRRVYYAFRALHGQDADCADYIAFAAGEPARPAAGTVAKETETTLRRAIEKGLRERAGELTQALLQTTEPLELVKGEIIPALDVVGQGFERGTVYLPQLLMSAEAAKSAFERIRVALSAQRTPGAARCRVVLATVHGDIHDIGKNIVKLLLENYGFAVTDLGRDVPPERVAEEVARLHAPLLGLSALMTTTVPAMEETIRRVRAAAPWCRIVVGGAVLNEGYAARIGADRYAADAMETVRYAEEVDGAQIPGV